MGRIKKTQINTSKKKERGYTVDDVVRDLNQEKDTYKDIVAVGVNHDGGLDILYSLENEAVGIGYIEIVKGVLLDDLR